MACMYKGERRNTGSPDGRPGGVSGAPVVREHRAGPGGVTERPVVAGKPGNAGGAKGPWSGTGAGRGERSGDCR